MASLQGLNTLGEFIEAPWGLYVAGQQLVHAGVVCQARFEGSKSFLAQDALSDEVFRQVSVALELPPMLQNTDALDALMKKAAG